MTAVEWLPPHQATDAAVVARITEVVNHAYRTAEAELWAHETVRTNDEDVAAAIRSGEIGVVAVDGRIIGAIRSYAIAADLWWFGALGVDPARAGTGIGSALVAAAEQRATTGGATTMLLQLLFPDPPLEHFVRLAGWYGRLGYREKGRVPLAEEFPDDAPMLTRACDVIEMRRAL